MHQLIPNEIAANVFSINLQALYEKGMRSIIFDIDDTLESHLTPVPSERTVALLKQAQEYGFRVCLISNGKPERVMRFNESLSLPAISRAGKPGKKNFKKALSLLDASPSTTVLVGDQIFTDVWGGNRMGFYTVLVDPIDPIENKFFYIKRYFEQSIRKKIKE